MNGLNIIPDCRSLGSWSPEEYTVISIETGQKVGRIFLNTAAAQNETKWFWQIVPSHAVRSKPLFGQAENKDAARQALSECWRDANKHNGTSNNGKLQDLTKDDSHA